MIAVTVKLHGTLPGRIHGYDPEKGLSIQLDPGTRVADLMTKLNIVAGDGAVVAVDGRVVKPEDAIDDGARIRIFQVALGG